MEQIKWRKKLGYKVVDNRDGKLFSCIKWYHSLDKLSVEYKPNETTLPQYPKSRLFFFEEKEEALHWQHGFSGAEVWRCQVAVGVIGLKPMTPDSVDRCIAYEDDWMRAISSAGIETSVSIDKLSQRIEVKRIKYFKWGYKAYPTTTAIKLIKRIA